MKIDLREAVNAMLYLAKTGCQWANLPGDFPNDRSVYYHYRKWCRDGTWERVNRALTYVARRALGRCPHPSAAILDSQSVKTTSVGGIVGYDAGKKVKGRKRHILVDTCGHLLKVVVHSASIQDRDGAKLLLLALLPILSLRLLLIWADGGCRGTFVDWCHQPLHALLEIVSPPSRPKRVRRFASPLGGRTHFAWLGNYRRLCKDYEHGVRSSKGMIYLASIHTLLNRLPS